MNLAKVLLFIAIALSIECFAQPQIVFKNLGLADGLSQNSVVDIAQDSIGFLWFATQDGLNRYNGYTFTHYEKYFWDITREEHVQLGKLFTDNQGQLWLIPQSGIPERYNYSKNEFVIFDKVKNVRCISQDKSGMYYFGTNEGLYNYNQAEDQLNLIFPNKIVSDVLQTSNGHLYIIADGAVYSDNGTKTSFQKLSSTKPYRLATCLLEINKEEIFIGTFGDGLFSKSSNQDRITQHQSIDNSLKILSLGTDKHNHLWIGTYGSGAIRLDHKLHTTRQFTAEKQNPYAIAYNDILDIFPDQSKNIWFGTDGAGLSFYDENLSKFNGSTNNQISASIQLDVVRSLMVDTKKRVWIGTSGKGLTVFDSQKKVQPHYTYTTQNSGLHSNRIMSLEQGIDETIWVGTQGNGIQFFDIKTEQFRQIENKEIATSTIWDIHLNKDRYWIATRNEGLLELNASAEIINVLNKNNSLLTDNNIRCIIDGPTDEELWLGLEEGGFCKYNKATNQVTTYPSNLNIKKIKSLHYDKAEKILWVGTNGMGLAAYDLTNNIHRIFRTNDGLPNNVIYGILSDKNKNLWLSTNQGICKFTAPKSLQDATELPVIKVYDTDDGLQSLEFNTGAYYKDVDDVLYFGGINGYNWFNPNEIKVNPIPPKAIITEFKVNGSSWWDKLLESEQTSISLKHNQHDISFSFSANNYSLPNSNQFRYQLIGYDEKEMDSSTRHFANYTNLAPGDYEFIVNASNYDGIWNEENKAVKFTIHPIWYNTTLAKIIFWVLIGLLLLGIYLFLRRRWQLQGQLARERQHASHLKEMTQFRSEFYTNITHDLRTPLAVIKGMTEEIEGNDSTKKMILKNSDHLLQLVNQILDLSKLENKELTFNYVEQDIIAFLKYLLESFRFLAIKKNISLQFSSELDKLVMGVDPEKMQQIISNLISNSIKFSNENGTVELFVKVVEDKLLIEVKDDGIGIDPDHLPHIFDRYYQVQPASNEQIGTGIGLTYVYELLSRMNGTIDVTSSVGQGTSFTISLPMTSKATELESRLPVPTTNPIIKTEKTTTPEGVEQASVLIIEDNEDVTAYLEKILSETYQFSACKNGKLGIEKALAEVPDLIISDVMMPLMDGFEVCDHLKNNDLTAHIPIILLTAKTGLENKKTGLRTGADAYLVKPFDKEELLIRIEQLLSVRKKLQRFYSSNIQEVEKEIPQDPFLIKLNQILEENYANETFKTPQLCEALFYSKMQVHRKLKALTDLSTSEYIRNFRLEKAKGLMETGNFNLSEIADNTGFSSLAYFSRSFKAKYQVSPSEYRSS